MCPPRRQAFGLVSDPTRHTRAHHIASPPYPRYKVFDAEELRAYFVAAATLKPHQRALAEALALTGSRPSWLGRMRWTELDLDQNVWSFHRGYAWIQRIVLPDAFARRLTEARKNLSADAGDYVFSATSGRTPLLHLGAMKAALAREMQRTLGHPPEEPWRWMDLRRTVLLMLRDYGSRGEDTVPAPRFSQSKEELRNAANRHADELEVIMRQCRSAAANFTAQTNRRIIPFRLRPEQRNHGDA